MYNAVTHEYLVNYKLDGKLYDSRVVSDPDELKRAMTMINALAAFDFDEPPPDRWVLAVRAELGSRNVMLLFSRTIATNWARVRLGQTG